MVHQGMIISSTMEKRWRVVQHPAQPHADALPLAHAGANRALPTPSGRPHSPGPQVRCPSIPRGIPRALARQQRPGTVRGRRAQLGWCMRVPTQRVGPGQAQPAAPLTCHQCGRMSLEVWKKVHLLHEEVNGRTEQWTEDGQAMSGVGCHPGCRSTKDLHLVVHLLMVA